MARILFDRFPGGHRKALTLSYDDGVVEDRRLVEILNGAGIRATFHLNSGTLSKAGRVGADEVRTLYAGHEVSVHGVVHACLPHLSRESIIGEILEDRRALERLVGYPVRGMSYAGGDFNDRVVDQLPSLGIEYARTTYGHTGFSIPDDFLRWQSTGHHRDCLAKGRDFLNLRPTYGLQLMYVWGHSYEFERNGNWDLIEQFCRDLGRNPAIWYATNIEIVDYCRAIRSVRCNVDGNVLHNLSGQEVWFTDCAGPEPVARSIQPGQLLQLDA
ncbi:MAG: hypothetical protein A2498_15010 [Lentisphaerae bacterium RIFOXYC12_FULL_60_16]|nr:MAG: hypothetical protein A2498_15010 [Lentisphaerae bacterium RIFOXYC12_FULL_60_16]OGV74543.1 MAG: hypothetical protein A2269_05155 [Lentisphaerae bacterium RIFOXYA12_FULL_60_10]